MLIVFYVKFFVESDSEIRFVDDMWSWVENCEKSKQNLSQVLWEWSFESNSLWQTRLRGKF